MSEWIEVDEPKIWVSRFFDTNYGSVSFDWACEKPKLEFVHASQDNFQTVSRDQAPNSIFFRNERIVPAKTRDAFKIYDGIFVISPAFRDVLVQFSIGDTQLFEVPIFEDSGGTPSEFPDHFVMNLIASSETLIPELSTDIRQPNAPRDLRWASNYRNDVLAVRADAAEKYDLWHDPQLRRRFFLSDRLKTAIDAAGLQVKGMELVPARVFTQRAS